MISHTKTHHKRADIQQFPSQSGEGTSDFNDLHVMDTLKPRAPGVVIAVGIAYTPAQDHNWEKPCILIINDELEIRRFLRTSPDRASTSIRHVATTWAKLETPEWPVRSQSGHSAACYGSYCNFKEEPFRYG